MKVRKISKSVDQNNLSEIRMKKIVRVRYSKNSMTGKNSDEPLKNSTDSVTQKIDKNKLADY